MRRFFDEVDVVDVPRRMELRHVQRVHVPELVLDQWPAHLLESHADELGFHEIQKLAIGMLLADADPRGFQTDGVFPEADLPPTPVFQHLRGEASRLFLGAPATDLAGDRLPGIRHAIDAGCNPLVNAERFVRVATFLGELLDECLVGWAEFGEWFVPVSNLAQQCLQRFGRTRGSSGQFDDAARDDRDRPLPFQFSDNARHIAGRQSFAGLKILDRERRMGVPCLCQGGEDACKWVPVPHVAFAGFGEGDDVICGLRKDADEFLRLETSQRRPDLVGLEPAAFCQGIFVRDERLARGIERGEDFCLVRMEAVGDRSEIVHREAFDDLA